MSSLGEYTPVGRFLARRAPGMHHVAYEVPDVAAAGGELAPLGDDTPVGRFLARRGPGMHHVAYEVPDVAAAVGELAALGADVIDPEPRTGLDGNAVSFVHPDSVHGVLVEVIGG